MSLQQLFALQEIDSAVDVLRHRRSHLPEAQALAATNAAIAKLEAEALSLTATRDTFAAQEHTLEVDDASLTKKLTSLQIQLAKSIMPKEAEALQHEIESVKSQRSNLEDRELELLDAIEPIEARLAAIAVETVPLREQAEAERAAFLAAQAALDAEVAAAGERRGAAAAVIDTDAVARYEKLRSHFGGIALARIDHGTCLGCNMKISTKELEAIKAAPPDAEVNCDECGRLLVR
jgi:uncharacterized protein